MILKRVSWFSIPGLSVLLIFLNALIPMPILVGIEFVILMLSFKQIRIIYSVVIALAIVFFQSYLSVLLGTNTFTLFLQQFICICITAAYWFTFINDQNIMEYLYFYKILAIFTALVSIFQYIMSLLGISSLATMSWLIRAQSSTPVGRSAAFLNEPSYCALVLFPLVFFGIYQLIGRYKSAQVIRLNLLEYIIIFPGFFFTGSSTGFFGVSVSIVVILLEYGISYKQVVILLLAVLCLGTVYSKVTFIHQRLNDSMSLVSGKERLDTVNLSTQSLIVNEKIAVDSFETTKGFGGGMGSHPLSYDKFVGNYGPNILTQNKLDANSLMLRIISELGIAGILILVILLYHYRFRKDNNSDVANYKIISRMCLCYIFMRLFRFGHYFDCGLYMFIAIYYQCYVISKKDKFLKMNGKMENAE